MKKDALKIQISELLPELKQSLKKTGNEIKIGGVCITRLEAERICENFEKELKSETEMCKIKWDIIPLKLVVADQRWRALQESLNQIKYI